MRTLRFLALVLLAAPSLAAAQSTESVTVTGTKSREVIQGFVQSFSVPTRLTGKLARWEDGICPVVVGLPSGFTKFVGQRLKEVAAQVGVPVNDRPSCKPNIAIVFTPKAQAFVDNIRDKQPVLLGYYDNSDQLEKLAQVTHPVQSWYMTATRDLQGGLQIDGAKPAGLINEIEVPCDLCAGGKLILHPDRVVSTTGARLGDGLRSDFYNVVIVADPTKLESYEIGELSDYIAMLALSQPGLPGTCQPLPSIVNLLAENCATKSSALTENDIAFLRGLYKMSPDGNLGTQKEQIAYQMEQALKGR